MTRTATRTRSLGLGVLTVTAALVLASCGDGASGSGGGGTGGKRLDTHGQEVIADTDGTGVDVSRRLFEKSDAVVVSGPGRDDQLRAAAVAAKLGAPMLVRLPGTDAAVDQEVQRLGAGRVLNVPGEDKDVTSTDPVASADPGDDVPAVLRQQPAKPLDMVLPPMFATRATSLAAAATARAAGADVQLLPAADPRATSDSMKTVSDQDTIAPQIVAMAEVLGLGIVIEGIEEENQAAYFLTLAPHALAQGWLFSKPVEASKLFGS